MNGHQKRDPVQTACSAQWQAERSGSNQYDAMRAAIIAYLRAESERRGGSVLLQAMAADLVLAAAPGERERGRQSEVG